MPCPVAHGEGRFAVTDDAALERLRAAGQIALTYVSEDGGEVGYPANPNGAAGDVAGICDPTGRVLGLMPHPERNLDPWAHPTWTRLPASRSEGEGLAFYRARGALPVSQEEVTPPAGAVPHLALCCGCVLLPGACLPLTPLVGLQEAHADAGRFRYAGL